MFDQPNPNLPEPEDMLSSTEPGLKPQTALEAGRLRPASPAGGPAGTPAEPSAMPAPAMEEVEIRSPLLNKRNLLIAGAAVLVIIVVVVVIILARGGAEPAPLAAPAALPEQVQVAPVEVVPLVEPTPPPPVEPAPVVTPEPEPVAPPDSDGDGLTDQEEAQAGTNSLEADTDKDGLNDREEAKVWSTNPLSPDTDGDGFTDGQEVQNGFNPNGPGKLLGPPPQS